MQAFLQRHQADVIGVLSGFDRLLFRGTLRSISYADGLDRFLGAMSPPNDHVEEGASHAVGTDAFWPGGPGSARADQPRRQ